jgi:hypothetical protein
MQQITALFRMTVLAKASSIFLPCSIGIVTGYQLDSRAGKYSPLHHIQTGCWAYLATYPRVLSARSPGVKPPEREADYSSPSSTEVKNYGAILLLPHSSSWRSA